MTVPSVEFNALLGTTDATKWAEVFRKCYSLPIDEMIMIGWFANAIETGRSAGWQSRRELEAAIRELPATLTGAKNELDAAYALGYEHAMAAVLRMLG